MTINKQIDERLQMLGITKKYKGYHFIKAAVELALEDEFRLQSVIKKIYIPVAEKYNCKEYNVIKDIGTVSHLIWRYNRDKLFEIANYEMTKEPPVSELISILAADIQRCEAEITAS